MKLKEAEESNQTALCHSVIGMEDLLDSLNNLVSALNSQVGNKASQDRPDEQSESDANGSKTETVLFETVAHGWKPHELWVKILKVFEDHKDCTLRMVQLDETKEDAVSEVGSCVHIKEGEDDDGKAICHCGEPMPWLDEDAVSDEDICEGHVWHRDFFNVEVCSLCAVKRSEIKEDAVSEDCEHRWGYEDHQLCTICGETDSD